MDYFEKHSAFEVEIETQKQRKHNFSVLKFIQYNFLKTWSNFVVFESIFLMQKATKGSYTFRADNLSSIWAFDIEIEMQK